MSNNKSIHSSSPESADWQMPAELTARDCLEFGFGPTVAAKQALANAKQSLASGMSKVGNFFTQHAAKIVAAVAMTAALSAFTGNAEAKTVQ